MSAPRYLSAAEAADELDISKSTLFAAGRLVGWIGHAREQYEEKQPIRPRATYTGPRPDSPTTSD